MVCAQMCYLLIEAGPVGRFECTLVFLGVRMIDFV